MSITPLIFQMKKAKAQSDQGDPARTWNLEPISALSSARTLGLHPDWVTSLYASSVVHPSIITLLAPSICYQSQTYADVINKIQFH